MVHSFFCVNVFAYMYVYALHTPRGQSRTSDSLELELQIAWVLGKNLDLFTSAASAICHRTIAKPLSIQFAYGNISCGWPAFTQDQRTGSLVSLLILAAIYSCKYFLVTLDFFPYSTGTSVVALFLSFLLLFYRL